MITRIREVLRENDGVAPEFQEPKNGTSAVHEAAPSCHRSELLSQLTRQRCESLSLTHE